MYAVIVHNVKDERPYVYCQIHCVNDSYMYTKVLITVYIHYKKYVIHITCVCIYCLKILLYF